MIMKFQSSFLFPGVDFIKSQTKQKAHSLVCFLVWTTHLCRKQESCIGISALRRTPWSQSDFHTDHFSSSLEHHSLSKDYQREKDSDILCTPGLPCKETLIKFQSIWNYYQLFELICLWVFLSSKQSSPTRKSKDRYSAGKTGKIRLETDLPYSWGVS